MIKLPFGWLPGHWGLKGKTRERARIDYEMPDGIEKDIALAALESLTMEQQSLCILEIRKKYNDISDLEYELARCRMTEPDEVKREVRSAEIKLAHKAITQHEHDRMVADAKKEPWVIVKNMTLADGTNGSIELDWNDYFVPWLEEQGFSGITPEDVVDQWLGLLCKHIAMEHYSGVGDFDERVEDRMQKPTTKREPR